MAENPSNGSLFKGFKKFNISEFDAYQPLDTATTRIIINNLEALNNASMQVRINAVHSSSQQKSLINDTDWYYSHVESYGPFPLTVLKNGEFSPLYVKIAASQTLTNATSASVVYVKLRPYNQRSSPTIDGYESQGSVSLTSSTLAWHNLNSTNSLLTISPSVAEYKAIRTKGLDSDTLIRTLDVPLFMLDIFADQPNQDDNNDTFNWLGVYAIELPWHIE